MTHTWERDTMLNGTTSSCAKLGLRNRIMNKVSDNEDMIGMEKNKYRRKGSGQINESDAEFEFQLQKCKFQKPHNLHLPTYGPSIFLSPLRNRTSR